jgi:UDP-N-acetylglucosamine 2-epimerase (non-hydrolysing)
MPDGEADRDRTIEGVPVERIMVTGNTSVDTLHAALERLQQDAVLKRRLAQRFSFLRAGSPLLLLATRGPAVDASEAAARALRDIAVQYPEMDIVCPVDPVRVPAAGSTGLVEACRNVHPIGPMDYLAWVYLLDMAYLILADEGVRMEAAALGKPVLLIQDMDIPDMEAAANRNVVKAGSGRIEIVARISSLLNGSRAYEAMRQASSERAPSDSYRPMLEALANLRSAPMAPADPLPDMSQDMDPPADARMQGVREAL